MPLSEPITEEWLRDVGFKWHELDRQPDKHWLLWIRTGGLSCDDLGIEVTPWAHDGSWFCWLRSDVAHRYHRFLHVRHLKTRGELVRLVEAISGQDWNVSNHRYGAVLTPDAAERDRRESERLDMKWRLSEIHHDVERDDSRGGALPEHLRAYEDARTTPPEGGIES